MPAIVQNAEKFLLTTDYSLDKIIWMNTGSLSIPANNFIDLNIPHGLSFMPLPLGSWSTSSDFSVSYEINTGPLGGTPFTINTGLSANGTNVILHTTNNTGSAVTVFYRLYAFMPSDQNQDAPFTSSVSSKFLLNTDRNYTKLFMANILTQGAVGGTPVSQTVNHNLGFYPQLAAWQEVSGTVGPLVFSTINGDGLRAEVTPTSVIFTFQGTAASRVHYRIYADRNE